MALNRENSNFGLGILKILECLSSISKEFSLILVHPSKIEDAFLLVKNNPDKTFTVISKDVSEFKKVFFKVLPNLAFLVRRKGLSINILLIDSTTNISLSLKEEKIGDIDVLEEMWRKS